MTKPSRQRTIAMHMNINGNIYSCGYMRSDSFLIRERWEDFSEYHVQKYFDKNYKTFLGVLDNFSNLNRRLTNTEEKELTFMLEALIDAKNILYDGRS